MEALGGERRYSSYSFSTSALDGAEWSASRPVRALTPGERTPGAHCIGGWVGLRAGLDTEVRGKILCPRRGSNLDSPVVQPVVRHYTAWANPAHLSMCTFWNKSLLLNRGPWTISSLQVVPKVSARWDDSTLLILDAVLLQILNIFFIVFFKFHIAVTHNYTSHVTYYLCT
jgi:hypothetical protein